MPDTPKYKLKTPEAAVALLTDLYINLRAALRRWSSLTFQTPQARMGYVGQHLVSVVTGFQGGRSGARGKDLILPDKEHAEIKTCYRIDQLGSCLNKACGASVASIETVCPACDGKEIARRDDSKWLIGVRDDDEMGTLFDPKAYYLVLFDFCNFKDAGDMNARIYRLDPRTRGFVFCMIDYYKNIKTSAPFNLWPFSLKFELMQPTLIYHAVIKANDTIETVLFPPKEQPVLISDLREFSQTKIKVEHLLLVAKQFGLDLDANLTKKDLLNAMQAARVEEKWGNTELADAIATVFYLPQIGKAGLKWIPKGMSGGPVKVESAAPRRARATARRKPKPR